jgi:ABC-type xylose transport system substrate-binding protein
MKACHIYISEPDHEFDRGLAAEANRFAEESTQQGFPMSVTMRYARGNETTQLQQIQDDRKAEPHPDLVVTIPINSSAAYDILYDTVKPDRMSPASSSTRRSHRCSFPSARTSRRACSASAPTRSR